MLSSINPTTTKAWKELTAHAADMKQVHMKELFATDKNRFEQFNIVAGDIVFDYSKNIINNKTMQLLQQLADECKVKEAIDKMFGGDAINQTEKRAVLHTALRTNEKFLCKHS